MDLENVSVALANLSISSDPVAQATVSTIATAISSYAQRAENLAETIENAYRRHYDCYSIDKTLRQKNLLGQSRL